MLVIHVQYVSLALDGRFASSDTKAYLDLDQIG